MAWHRYTLVVIGLTASLCVQKGNSDGNSTGQTPSPEAVCETPECQSAVIPAGVLQRPLYSKTFQNYMNYGAIGTAIGHEMTRGFVDNGRLYDSHGNFSNWWAAEDSTNFHNKTKCFRNQNSRIHIDEIGLNLNSELTQGQSVADRGGLKMAFRSYKNHVRKAGQQPRLHGLDLSQDQVFFLSFAQQYCASYTPERLIAIIETADQAPGKYRIIGALRHSQDFARAYNCSAGSIMNPARKCFVW